MARVPVAVLLLVVAAGCVRTYTTDVVEVLSESAQRRPLKDATNLPAEFVVLTPPSSAGGCAARLRDAGLNTTLTLVHAVSMPAPDSAGTAHSWYGDYEVEPVGRYGELEGEGLRIDCTRLRAVGVVRLRAGGQRAMTDTVQ